MFTKDELENVATIRTNHEGDMLKLEIREPGVLNTNVWLNHDGSIEVEKMTEEGWQPFQIYNEFGQSKQLVEWLRQYDHPAIIFQEEYGRVWIESTPHGKGNENFHHLNEEIEEDPLLPRACGIPGYDDGAF